MSVEVVSDNTFSEKVLDVKDRFVLVDFWAEWCGPCKMLTPVIEKMAVTFRDKLTVYKLDTDASPQTAQKMQITGIPCCILFKDGKEVTRYVGFRNESTFQTELSQQL